MAGKRKTVVREQYLTPQSQKALADRLARAEGHLRSIRQMVIDQRCADEILIQVAAVKAALNHFSSTLVETEMKACVDTCMAGEADERLSRVTNALAALLKS
ncbi:MAG TPA: metal-sensitive transcriptional regulator [Thermoanaerobaculia bacterium]|nr:metal-sensitive transcriptional regulator [Thermoanaerobaculia bacterium]